MRPLLAVLAAALVAAPSAHASSGQLVLFEAGSRALDPDTRAPTLDELQALGVRALRVTVLWREAEPEPGVFDIERHAALAEDAAARGMRVAAVLTGPAPAHVTPDGVTRPSPARFRAFAAAAGARLGAVVDIWSLWNEPNHPGFLKPQYAGRKAISPGLYRALFRAGTRGLEAAGEGGATWLAGETAPGGDRRHAMPPLQFLRGVHCRGCARLAADGWAHHPYSNRRGPFHVPPDRDNVTIGVLHRLHAALRKARRPLPVWVTEFGVQSAPDPYLGVSLAQQAEFRSIAERLARDDKQVAAFSQYLLVDDAPRPDAPAKDRYAGFESGLVGHDGARKPSFDEFRLPLAVRRRGKEVWLWGLVRPAAGATRVEVLTADRGTPAAGAAATRPTDGRGAWTARLSWREGRTWRVRWTAPDGTVHTGPPVRAYR